MQKLEAKVTSFIPSCSRCDAVWGHWGEVDTQPLLSRCSHLDSGRHHIGPCLLEGGDYESAHRPPPRRVFDVKMRNRGREKQGATARSHFLVKASFENTIEGLRAGPKFRTAFRPLLPRAGKRTGTSFGGAGRRVRRRPRPLARPHLPHLGPGPAQSPPPHTWVSEELPGGRGPGRAHRHRSGDTPGPQSGVQEVLGPGRAPRC